MAASSASGRRRAAPLPTVCLLFVVLWASSSSGYDRGGRVRDEKAEVSPVGRPRDWSSQFGLSPSAVERLEDQSGRYKWVDEIDIEAIENGLASERRQELGAEALLRCLDRDRRTLEDERFCESEAELLKEKTRELEGVMLRAAHLLQSEARAVPTKAERAKAKQLARSVKNAALTGPEKKQANDLLDEMVRGLRGGASSDRGTTPRTWDSKSTLLELADRVDRHLTTSGIESENPLEGDPKKLWPNPVPYSFWNPPDDQLYGLVGNVEVSYPFSKLAKLVGAVAKTDRKAFPYYDATTMIDPNRLTTFKRVTPEIVSSWVAATKHVEAQTCLRFKEVAMDDACDKILIVRDANSDVGAASHGIGRTLGWKLPGGKHGLHMIHIGKDDTGVGGLVHELLHALGMGHTQQRSDASAFLKYYRENIHDKWLAQYTFMDTPPDWFSEVDDALAFDFGSIMSYPCWGKIVAKPERLANASPGEKDAWGRLRMMEAKVPADLKQRALNEDPNNGGLGQVNAVSQGRMSFIDVEIIARHYKCTDHQIRAPKNAELDPRLAAASPLCACPAEEVYQERVARLDGCLDGASKWADAIAEVVRTKHAAIKAEALRDRPVQEPKTKASPDQLRKWRELHPPPDAKLLGASPGVTAVVPEVTEGSRAAQQERDSIVAHLGPKMVAFVARCRQFCSVQPDFKSAKCWVDARPFAGPLTPDKTITKPTAPWSFRCGQRDPADKDKDARLGNYGCFYA